MEIAEIIKSGPAVWVGSLAVVGALYKSIKSLLEYNDEYIQKRLFKKYSFLLSETSGNDNLVEFIKKAKEEEAFRVAFGKPASPSMATAIMELYRSGHFSLSELRACFLYTKLLPNGTLEINPGKSGYFVLGVSIFFILMMGLYISTLVVTLLTAKAIPATLIAIGLLIFYFFFAWLFGRDARAVVLARRANKKVSAIKDEIPTSN